MSHRRIPAITLVVVAPLVLTLALLPMADTLRAAEAKIDPTTGVDHDGQPIEQPAKREKNLYGHQFREAVVEPLSHAFDVPDKLLWVFRGFSGDGKPQSVNVNRFDEVGNSTWFTNRNHVRSLSPADVRRGAGDDVAPTPPYTIKSWKRQGVNPGFNIKDAKDRRWVVKLDPPGHPQLGSGADVVVSRLLYAAGYNVPHDASFTFRRDDLIIDPDLARGENGEAPFLEANLDTLLTHGARNSDGRSYAQASLFLAGAPIGHIDMRGVRPDDANDLYPHQDRRELRGLYVLMSWLNSWDTKDHQSLDTFITTGDSLGHVRHHLLDLGASLGASAEGAKDERNGYEYKLDWGWNGRRFLSLGFATEPWRRARQETGIPAVGNFASAEYEPDQFKTLMPHPAFGKRTSRDAYWGAKLVASFSNAQIAAAIAAAGYEDPRAAPALLQILCDRRDMVARYWFDRVAPVDYFHVEAATLHFRDLAVDRALERPRAYHIHLRSSHGERTADAASTLVLRETALGLDAIAGGADTIELEVGIEGQSAAPTTVELRRTAGEWVIARVVHG